MASKDAKWYVAHTYSGYENKVASDLATMVESRGMQDLIQDIKIPTETVVEIKEDKRRAAGGIIGIQLANGDRLFPVLEPELAGNIVAKLRGLSKEEILG